MTPGMALIGSKLGSKPDEASEKESHCRQATPLARDHHAQPRTPPLLLRELKICAQWAWEARSHSDSSDVHFRCARIPDRRRGSRRLRRL